MSKVIIPTPKELSPYLLIQEFLRKEPWKLLAACIMLNQTTARQVHQVINEFFDEFPTPERLLDADEEKIKTIIAPLGLKNVRYKRLIWMTLDWYQGKRPPDKIHGIGKYASDSYRIFIEGYLVEDVQDKELKNYVRWAKEQLRGKEAHHGRSGRVQRDRKTIA